MLLSNVMTRLVKIKDVDVSKIEFKIDDELTSIWVTYDGDRVLFQFPPCSVPFKKAMGDYKNNKQYNLTVQIPNSKVSQVLSDIEAKYVKFMAENLSAFKKKKVNNMSYDDFLDHSLNSVNLVRYWQDLSLMKFKMPYVKDSNVFNVPITRKGEDTELRLTSAEEDLEVLDNAGEYVVVARLYGNFINNVTLTMRAVRMMITGKEQNQQYLEDSESEHSGTDSDYDDASI